jgi:5'-deoxynucleotidase YfbR-like HD superfamily hydrolase
MLTLDQLKLSLNLHNVKRFQTHRLQQTKSVAEHSFRVAALYNYLGGKELIPAMCHDIEEAITGDIPSPAKKHIKGLDYFENMRPKFEDTREARLGKLCDKLELVLDLREQLEDTGKLPKRLMQVYEDELESVHDIAKELGIAKEVKQLLRELSK